MSSYLAAHPQVEKVNHPSLPDHPQHALYEKYFPHGGASIFAFEMKGSQEEAHKFIDNLEIFSLLANAADGKSLVIHPATTIHSRLTAAELPDQGIQPNTIRLSVGTEHIDDILADLEKGFAAAAKEAQRFIPHEKARLSRRAGLWRICNADVYHSAHRVASPGGCKSSWLAPICFSHSTEPLLLIPRLPTGRESCRYTAGIPW